MKRNRSLLVIVLLIGAICVYYCMMEDKDDYQIVKFRGAALYSNLSKSDIFLWVNINQDSISALPVIHDDLIYLFWEEDAFVYRYLITDGNELHFKIEDYKLFLNGQLINIKLKDPEDPLHHLEELEKISINNLRSIHFSTDTIQLYYEWLKKTAEMNPNIGLVFEYDIEGFEEILSLFDPSCLFTYDHTLNQGIQEQIKQMKNLEILGINASVDEINKLKTLPKLQHIIITDLPHPEEGMMLELSNQIKSLTLIRPEINNIEFLKNLIYLKELNIISADKLHNINAIKTLKSLEVINFKGCDTLIDLNPLNQMPPPTWLSLPVNTSQNDFETIFDKYKYLEVVELVDCDSIQDLSSINKMEDLKCLTVSDMDINIESLYSLKELNYLSVPELLEEDSTKMIKLSEKLPNTVIVTNSGGGVCLGTGWLFLIFPLLIIIYLILFLIRKLYKQ